MSGTLEKTRRERRKDARPAELTSAALELFVERGFAATRLEDVAARAGVSKGTLYLYFESKEELFKAVVREGMVPVLVEGEQFFAGHRGPVAELLSQMYLVWWQRVGSKPVGGLTKLMMSEARNFPEIARFYHEEVVARGHGLMRALIERGITAGEFRAMDVERAVHIAMAPLLQFVAWRHSFGCCGLASVDGDAYVREAAQFVLRGLAADQGATS